MCNCNYENWDVMHVLYLHLRREKQSQGTTIEQTQPSTEDVSEMHAIRCRTLNRVKPQIFLENHEVYENFTPQLALDHFAPS